MMARQGRAGCLRLAYVDALEKMNFCNRNTIKIKKEEGIKKQFPFYLQNLLVWYRNFLKTNVDLIFPQRKNIF